MLNKKNDQSSSCAEHGFENSDGVSKTSLKWEEFVKELKMQWKKMWCERFNDKVRAEGIAIGDYPFLFLERGTVVIAIRRYRVPDFFEILEHHRGLMEVEKTVEYINPLAGGWRKFIKSILSKQQRFTRRKKLKLPKNEARESLQKKKGGRGWIHRI